MKKFLYQILLCLALSLIFFPKTIAKGEDLMNQNNATLNNEVAIGSAEENNINPEGVVEVFSNGSVSLNVTQADIDLMAKLVYAESRGEPFDGQIAVASVVLNRVLNNRFPNTISEVIFQRNAFSCVKDGNIVAYPDQTSYNAVYEALSGVDPTNEALFFYNPSISTCSWMQSTQKNDVTSIGHHVFFKS